MGLEGVLDALALVDAGCTLVLLTSDVCQLFLDTFEGMGEVKSGRLSGLEGPEVLENSSIPQM